MDDAGATIVDGEVRIDHAEIEAALLHLASAGNVTVKRGASNDA